MALKAAEMFVESAVLCVREAQITACMQSMIEIDRLL